MRLASRFGRINQIRRTRAVTGIDGDVKLNRTLRSMAENMLGFFGHSITPSA